MSKLWPPSTWTIRQVPARSPHVQALGGADDDVGRLLVEAPVLLEEGLLRQVAVPVVEQREALGVDGLGMLEHVAHREALSGPTGQVTQQDGAPAEVGADLEEVAADAVRPLEPVQLDQDAEVERREPSRHGVEGEEVGTDGRGHLVDRLRRLGLRRAHLGRHRLDRPAQAVVGDELVAGPGDGDGAVLVAQRLPLAVQRAVAGHLPPALHVPGGLGGTPLLEHPPAVVELQRQHRAGPDGRVQAGEPIRGLPARNAREMVPRRDAELGRRAMHALGRVGDLDPPGRAGTHEARGLLGGADHLRRAHRHGGQHTGRATRTSRRWTKLTTSTKRARTSAGASSRTWRNGVPVATQSSSASMGRTQSAPWPAAKRASPRHPLALVDVTHLARQLDRQLLGQLGDRLERPVGRAVVDDDGLVDARGEVMPQVHLNDVHLVAHEVEAHDLHAASVGRGDPASLARAGRRGTHWRGAHRPARRRADRRRLRRLLGPARDRVGATASTSPTCPATTPT